MKCMQEEQQDKCEHSDEERQFTGDFVSVELHKALQMGYKVWKSTVRF